MMFFISRPFFKTAVLCAAVLSWVIISSPATAQNNDIRAVMSRLNQMDNQIQTLSQQVYRGEQQIVQPRATYDGSLSEGGNTAARLNSRLSTMEEEMRQMNGKVEKQTYAIDQLKRDFDVFKSDLEIRLGEIERQVRPQTSYTPPAPTPTPAPIASTPSVGFDTTLPTNDPSTLSYNDTISSDFSFDNPSTLYDQSFQAIRDQDFDKAQQGFEEFLTRYNGHKLAGNAKYWLGETFYVRGDYNQALKIFAEGYQQYPQGNKAPDNLLKLALTLAKADRTTDACLSLKQLHNDFPNAAAAIKNRAKKESTRLGCG